MSIRDGLFSSTSVSDGHRKRLAERVYDAVLDELFRFERAHLAANFGGRP